MSAEERTLSEILQMLQDGKISAEEAAQLMRALDSDVDENQADPARFVPDLTDASGAEAEIEAIETGAGSGQDKSEAPEFDEVRARARRFALIPLWIGVFITVLSAWIIYSIQQNAGINFWFYCMVLPLMLGVLLIALGAGGESSRWIYFNVDRREANEGPRNLAFGFPLPLGLTAWFLRNFGYNMQVMKKTNVDEIIQVLEATGKSDEPLIINVSDDEGGERVQVYIG